MWGNSSALILASTFEGFPLVTVEVISHRIPVVSSNYLLISSTQIMVLFKTKHIYELNRILQGIVDESLNYFQIFNVLSP